MKFGILFLPTYVPELDGSEAQAYQNMLEQVDRAEALGFEGVWLTEHHFQYYGGLVPAPPILAAAIAQRTRRIRLGMAVTLLPFHRPVRVAEDLAMVDILSGGRLDWGVGRGFLNWEYQNLGVAVEESRDRFAECLDIVLKAWTEDSFTDQGRFHQYRDLSVVPRPIQRPHPPIWFAASASDESFILAGRRGYNLMTIPHTHAADDILCNSAVPRSPPRPASIRAAARSLRALLRLRGLQCRGSAPRRRAPVRRNMEIVARLNALERITAPGQRP